MLEQRGAQGVSARLEAALNAVASLELRTSERGVMSPQLVPAWLSPLLITEYFYVGGSNATQQFPGSIVYDEGVGVLLNLEQNFDFAPPGLPGVLITNVNNADGQQVVISGQCRRTSSKPSTGDWFAWLPYSVYTGTSPCDPGQTNGLQCDWYALVTPNVTLRLAINDQLPYFWYVFNRLSPQLAVTAEYLFSSPVVNTPPPQIFASVPNCEAAYAPPCPYSPLRPVVEMIRFHQPNDTSLAQQNTGDVAGDTAFLCYALLSGTFAGLQQVSMYQVQVNYTFGSYAYCNDKLCLGGDPLLVGREATFGLGVPRAGQCTPNPYGSWYSMPAKGQCQPGQSVDLGQCFWKVVDTIKTISVACLIEQGFENACRQDPYMPFAAAQKVLVAAFASKCPAQ